MARIAHTDDNRVWLGDDDGFVPAAAAHPEITTVDGALRAATAGRLSPREASAQRVPGEQLRFSNPVPPRRKLWGIGLNYVDHAGDLDEEAPEEPASFMKPATAFTGPGGPIRLPPPSISDGVTAEAELAVVIGQTCTDIGVDEAADVIAGYLPVIDMTAEDILRRNPRFLTRAKSFDTFLVAGPWITTQASMTGLDSVEVRTIVNEEVIAANQIENMTFRPAELVAFHSRVMTLEPGDLISTGTPGAGEIAPGDTVRAEVDGVGSVTAPVVGPASDD